MHISFCHPVHYGLGGFFLTVGGELTESQRQGQAQLCSCLLAADMDESSSISVFFMKKWKIDGFLRILAMRGLLTSA